MGRRGGSTVSRGCRLADVLVLLGLACATSLPAQDPTPQPTPSPTPTSAATPTPAAAATPTPTATPAPDEPWQNEPTDLDTSPSSGGNWVDLTHRWIKSKSEQAVTTVDSWFVKGEPRQPDDWVQVRVKLWAYDDHDGSGFKPEVSATVPLPNLEHRFNLYADNLAHNVLPGTDPSTTERQFRVGSRASLFGGGHWRVTTDLGVGYSSGPTAHSEVRFRAWWDGADWQANVVQSAFWTSEDRFGELTQITYDKRLTPAWYLRLQAAGKYTQDYGEWRSSEVVRLGWVLDPYRHYLAGTLVFWSRGALSEEYRAELTYRVRVYRPWMFLELTPIARFPREEEFSQTWGFRVGVDMFFGGVPEL